MPGPATLSLEVTDNSPPLRNLSPDDRTCFTLSGALGAKISETKSLFLEKTSKIDKPLVKLIKKKRRYKSIQLEVKMEKLQMTLQKYK